MPRPDESAVLFILFLLIYVSAMQASLFYNIASEKKERIYPITYNSLHLNSQFIIVAIGSVN